MAEKKVIEKEVYTHSKKQLVESEKFYYQQDLLNALLHDNYEYTVEQVESMLKELSEVKEVEVEEVEEVK